VEAGVREQKAFNQQKGINYPVFLAGLVFTVKQMIKTSSALKPRARVKIQIAGANHPDRCGTSAHVTLIGASIKPMRAKSTNYRWTDKAYLRPTSDRAFQYCVKTKLQRNI
jgi:hypothetical protein